MSTAVQTTRGLLLRGLRRWADRASIYLPVALMGLVALATWWLARSTPEYKGVDAPRAARHEPDYFMRGFSVRTFDAQGRLKSEVTGAEIRHYPDTDTLEIDRAQMKSYNPQGALTTATADRALSNGDGSEVQLFGNARVLRESSGGDQPPLEFRSEFLHAFLNEERVKSHKPVTLTRGAERFSAESMEFDNLGRLLRLDGRVRAQLVPPGARVEASQ